MSPPSSPCSCASPRRRSRGALGLGLAVLVGIEVPAREARADDPAAQTLFDEGRKLALDGKVAEACPKFEASYKLDTKSLGTLLNLADCLEKTGKIASAWSRWAEAYDLARTSGPDERFTKAAAVALEHRDALAPRLPKVTFAVRAKGSKLTIWKDGFLVDPGSYGVALPLDPGEHEVRVQRGDEVLERRTVSASEGGETQVELDLDAIEALAPPPKPVSRPVLGPAPRAVTIAGITVGSLGLAALGAAAGVFIAAAVREDEAGCRGGWCSPRGYAAIGDARTLADASQWTLVAGAGLTAVGAALLLVAPPGSAAPSAPSGSKSALRAPGLTWASPAVGGGWGLRVGAAF